MDGKPEDPSVYISHREINVPIFIFSILVALVLGSFLGFLGNNFLTQKASKKLPVPINILKNPIFTQWTAATEGTLVKKDDGTFTLSNNGGELTITIHDKLTGFVALPASNSGRLKQYQIDEIPLGSYMRGAVTIFPQASGGLTNKPGEHIIGNAFTIEKLGQ